MNKYDPKKIESKWQKFWEENKTFAVAEDNEKEKFYGLIEFPYPSGAGLHVGHPRSYTAMDVITRKKRMEGKNVLFPIGFDSFGLPTENFAIKTGRPPQEITDENIATFTRQLKSLGFGFDWDRAVTTSEPEYYKWTQWIFLQLHKHGLAYKANQPINWCPKDKIGLANEEVVDGNCERCGTPVEKRNKEQWMLAITKYADKLLEGLNEVDYITRAKVQQENWIGKSEGAEINFTLNVPGQELGKHSVTVFTTRPDTIFGATFLAISAELAKKWIDVGWQVNDEVKKYIGETLQSRTTAVAREELVKTGVATNVAAVNPASGEEISVWIVNYVMGDYGTGAIMAVPAHDERDWEFAKKYNLPIRQVVAFEVFDSANPPRPDKQNTERTTVHAILRNSKNNSVLLEFLKGEEWGDRKPINFVLGGVEEGETAKDAAIREIKEETGYTDIKFVAELPVEVQSQFYQAKKDVNRLVRIHTLVFDLVSDARQDVSAEENTNHESKWIDENDVAGLLNTPDDQLVWNYYQHDGMVYTGSGTLINSGQFDGQNSEIAKKSITEFLGGTWKTNYKLRDWVFSRQRYWGEPIPLVFCEACRDKKYNFILVHGYTSSSNRGFKPWLAAELEKQGHTVWNPDLPNTDKPNVDGQADFVLANAPFFLDEHTVLVGHSLGGPVVYRILEKINQKIAKAIFVDPVYKPEFSDKPRPAVEKSCDWNFDWKKISESAHEHIILGDSSEKTIKHQYLRDLRTAINGQLTIVTPTYPHFSSIDGEVTQEPEILKNCLAKGWIPLPEDQLPLTLPHVEKYLPTDTGESPLAPMTDWVNTTCPQCGGPARRETDTMPNWAGSSWYWLRYADPHNAQNFFAETDFRFKSEIETTEKDTMYLEAFKKIYSELDAQGIPIFAANRLLLNGLNGRLWLPLKTVSVMYWNRDTKKVFAYLKDQGYALTTEHKGGHMFEQGGVRVEMIPVFEENGQMVSYSTTGVAQSMSIADLLRVESAHIQDFWYRTVSPEYNLRHLVYVRDNESEGRAGERDEEKITFLESYLKNINSKIRYFTPVDWYNGGMEHTVLHLLYSRFWNQFLYDIGVVPTREPYKKRTSHGMILAKGGEKMSKSKGNVVNPDEMVDEYGADALRAYIMFMGPFDQAVEWDTNGLVGVRRFLERVWNLQEKITDDKIHDTRNKIQEPHNKIQTILHQTIKKISDDIESMRFNTAIAKLMELSNEMTKEEKIDVSDYQTFIKLLAPFAPHIGEELWTATGGEGSVAYAPWPQYDPELAKESQITVVAQVNGKVRDEFVVSPEISEEEMKQLVLSSEKVQKWLEGKEPKKVIYVKGKLVSIVS